MRDVADLIACEVNIAANVFDVGGVGRGDVPHLNRIRDAFAARSSNRRTVDIDRDADVVLDLDSEHGRDELAAGLGYDGYTYAFISQTLDHLEEPMAVVRACLAADALIVISGNPYSPIFRVLQEKQRLRGASFGHMYNWSRKSMAAMLGRAGWRVEKRYWLGCSKWCFRNRLVNAAIQLCPFQWAVSYALVCTPQKHPARTIKCGVVA